MSKKTVIIGIAAIVVIAGAIILFQNIGQQGQGLLTSDLEIAGTRPTAETSTKIDRVVEPIDLKVAAPTTEPFAIKCFTAPEKSIKVKELAKWSVEASNVPEGADVKYAWSGNYKDNTTAIADFAFIYNIAGTYRATVNASTGRESASTTCALTVTPAEGEIDTVEKETATLELATIDNRIEPIELVCEANPNSIDIEGISKWSVKALNLPEDTDISYAWSGNFNDPKYTTALTDDHTYIYHQPGTYTAEIEGKVDRQIGKTRCVLTVKEAAEEAPTIDILRKINEPIDEPVDDSTIGTPFGPADEPVEESGYTGAGEQDEPDEGKDIPAPPAETVGTAQPATPDAAPANVYCAGYTDALFDNNCPATTYVKNEGIITGQGDGTIFAPDNKTNRAESAKMFSIKEGFDNSIEYCNGQPFPDVSLTAWYAQYACFVKINGIMQGHANGNMEPANVTTRAEFTTMILRAYDIELPATIGPNFLDVFDYEWHNSAMQKAYELTFFPGNYGYPNTGITRLEAAKIFYKMHLLY